ncbi:MAG: guanylate kinase [Saprospiraceae bacterium]
MNKLILFTAPSGAGKTTIVQHLLKQFDRLSFSVSATNRKRREHEIHGKDYYFLSTTEFQRRVTRGDFLEWEEVYEKQYYGTLKREIKRVWNENKHVIFDIDVKGACSIKEAYPDTLAVFVKPPSPEVLFERLRNRRTETEKSLQKRIKRAKLELEYENKFDLVLVNDILEDTFEKAEKIMQDFISS